MNLSGLTSVTHSSLSSVIADSMRKAIMEGVFEPGQRIVEATLAEHYGISRAPIREAIMELEKQGLVWSVPRKGTFVAEWTDTDVWEIYTLRMALEGMAARLVAKCITSELQQDLQSIVDQIREVENKDQQKSVELDLRFHARICAAATHTRLQELLRRNQLQMELYIRRTHARDKAWGEGLADEHQHILDALCSGDPDLAERVLRETIEHSSRLLRDVEHDRVHSR